MSSVEHTQTNADERKILVSSPSPMTPARCPANGAATAEIKPTRAADFVPLDTILFVLTRTRQPTKVASEISLKGVSLLGTKYELARSFVSSPRSEHAIQATHPMANITSCMQGIHLDSREW